MSGGAGAPLSDALRAGAEALGVVLAPGQNEQLLTLVAELASWNRRFNLTAIDDPAQMIPLHVLDSLAVSPWLAGNRVLDVGTGAGFPGLPLAIAHPQRSFTLLDSAARKTRFVVHAVAKTGLANVEVANCRVADYRPVKVFDSVLARAYAPLPRLVNDIAHLCGPTTRLLALKGRYPRAELEELPPGWQASVERLRIPGIEAQRHLVVLSAP